MRSTTVHSGERSLAPATNIAPNRRTVAVRSASGPTMKPGVSHSETTGSPYASQMPRNRVALSAASASIAPPRWVGSLASTATGWPSSRANAVRMPTP